jgi:hypothetical protein
MSRKDYTKIAEILGKWTGKIETAPEFASFAMGAIAGELSIYFQEDNPEFDRLRFLNAIQRSRLQEAKRIQANITHQNLKEERVAVHEE